MDYNQSNRKYCKKIIDLKFIEMSTTDKYNKRFASRAYWLLYTGKIMNFQATFMERNKSNLNRSVKK